MPESRLQRTRDAYRESRVTVVDRCPLSVPGLGSVKYNGFYWSVTSGTSVGSLPDSTGQSTKDAD